MPDLIATRANGLIRLKRRNANGRNYDHGPGMHTTVSVLSPWIRRRLVTEADVVATVLAAHGLDAQGVTKC
jgi:deoxyribodipyrimidine photo-lyase